MKTRFIIAFTLFVLSAHAQIQKCYTYEMMQHQEQLSPGYLNSVQETFYRAKQSFSQDRSTVYTIPVVVHIVYNGAAENLDDSVVFNQIAVLNETFRRTNPDTVNMRSVFEPIVGDTYIEFKLAQIDPNGQPTNGITRTSTTQNSFFGVGGFPAEGVKSSSDGGIDPWDQNRYLNIWVCDMSLLGSPFILGYASPPNNLPHWPPGSSDNLSDGVVIQYESFGANNPNTLDLGQGVMEVMGKTAVHEVGHYLGLRHIWGDGDCNEEDGIDDTPNATDQSDFDCDTTKNTCTDNILTLGDLPDMIENYMDYSSDDCQNSFTQGQADMMRAILENERIDLISGNPASIEKREDLYYQIFPNPSTSNAIITGLQQEVSILIFNERGQLVFEKKASDQVVLPKFDAGTYSVKLIGSNTVKTERFLQL